MARRVLTLVVLLLGVLIPAAGAHAAVPATAAPQQDVAIPLIPESKSAFRPPGFSVTVGQALALAKQTPTMQSLHRSEHPLIYAVFYMPGSHYEVDFWYRGKATAGVMITPSGRVGVIYRGPLVLGLYARGNYSPTFDNPWVWVPFGLAFLLPILLLRGLAWLDRLDLGVVLAFGVSYTLFNTQIFEPGVWLAYPPLLYLFGRMLWRGLRARPRARELRIALPTGVLIAGLLVLIGARIAVALAPNQIMDVGYASMIGAYKILHGQSIYFPSVGHPDTYGPVNYLAYAPFEALWPVKSWAGFVPGARIAVLTFDLITIGGLVQIGRRLLSGRAGLRLGLVLAWLWAACPFTVLPLIKSSNDGLVAMFMVLVLLAMASPVKRGVLLGLAAAAKFSPAILLPLIAVGPGAADRGPMRRALAAFVVAAGASVALFLPPGGLKEMWQHTLGFQLSRPDIFSPWALHPGLAPVKDVVELAVIALAFFVAVRPRGPRSQAQVSALAAALTIGVQLPALHWFYLYIDWFMPLVLIAVLGGPVRAALAPPAVPARAPVLDIDPEPELAGAL
ncbi:MAG: hypothetical protein QOG59_1829 [Solirubrobacteraceae bacterium]|nr:hypothetical protein [Solirubrobacteraceae bacterium]